MTALDTLVAIDTNSIHFAAPNAFEIFATYAFAHKTSNQTDSKSKTDNLFSSQWKRPAKKKKIYIGKQAKKVENRLKKWNRKRNTLSAEGNWNFCQSNWRCQVSKNAICTANEVWLKGPRAYPSVYLSNQKYISNISKSLFGCINIAMCINHKVILAKRTKTKKKKRK